MPLGSGEPSCARRWPSSRLVSRRSQFTPARVTRAVGRGSGVRHFTTRKLASIDIGKDESGLEQRRVSCRACGRRVPEDGEAAQPRLLAQGVEHRRARAIAADDGLVVTGQVPAERIQRSLRKIRDWKKRFLGQAEPPNLDEVKTVVRAKPHMDWINSWVAPAAETAQRPWSPVEDP